MWIHIAGFLISQIKSVSGRLFERILQDCRWRSSMALRGRILYVLWQADRVPCRTLSKGQVWRKNTLTSMLGRMEEERFDPAGSRARRTAAKPLSA